jgi:hypothetical protein
MKVLDIYYNKSGKFDGFEKWENGQKKACPFSLANLELTQTYYIQICSKS